MGRWTYYSPLWLGPLLVLALNDVVRQPYAGLAAWVQWLRVAFVAVEVALALQLLVFGAQGAFAQVVPVPWGKSIRGRPAVLVGWLLIADVVLGAIGYFLRTEDLVVAPLVLGGLGLVGGVAALTVYVWNIPAAVPDFGLKD